MLVDVGCFKGDLKVLYFNILCVMIRGGALRATFSEASLLNGVQLIAIVIISVVRGRFHNNNYDACFLSSYTCT
jgi:hypothetical protein